MTLVKFRGIAAEMLWRHIADHLALLDYVPDLECPDAERRRAAEVAMVTFMATAAWGYNPVSDAKYGSRFDRLIYLSNINNDIYVVSRSRGEILVSIGLGRTVREISLGRASGFSAALPLTSRGYRDYQLNAKAMSDLEGGDIVPSPYASNTIEFVLLAGLVDFRALPLYLAGDRRFPGKAHGLLAGLGRQVGNFIPRVELRQDGGRVYARSHAGRKLPTIVCPLSGRGIGEELLNTAGFLAEGSDARHNRVWVLDLGEVNGRMVTDRYLKKLFKANRYIDRCRD